MSLNEYLCKHFEKDVEGNVTIGKIIEGILIGILSIIFKKITAMRLVILYFMWIMGLFTKYFILQEIPQYPPTIYDIILMPLYYGIIGIIIVVLIYHIIKIFWNMKVAKCLLQEQK